MWNSTCHFLLILTLTFDIYFTEGIWISKPTPVNKCIGQTAHLTWEYTQECNEEIKQFQWFFNGTELIAYSSMTQGFNVQLKYQGRVDKSGESGILLKNISTKDIGNYTFYPLIAWEKSPNIQTVWLNVIDRTMEQECTCEKLQISPAWKSGQTYSIVAEGCNLQINSSFCCPKGPAIEYCENDPQRLCVPINLTESTTQSRIVTQERAPTGNTELDLVLHDLHVNKGFMISFLVINCLCLMCTVINCLCWMSWIHCLKIDKSKNIQYEGRSNEDNTESEHGVPLNHINLKHTNRYSLFSFLK